MSVISSFASTAGFYQVTGVNSLAHSPDAVAGTEHAFADAERQRKQNDEDDDEPGSDSLTDAAGETSGAAADPQRFLLNVTA